MRDNLSKKQITGVLLVLSYCLLVAPSWVYLHNQEQSISPLVAAFYIFFIACISINILGLHHIRPSLLRAKNSFRPLLGINISTTISWLAQFTALIYINSGTVNSIAIGILPLATYLISFIRSTKKLSLFNIESLFAIFIFI